MSFISMFSYYTASVFTEVMVDIEMDDHVEMRLSLS